MADRLVQLKDRDGEKINPLSAPLFDTVFTAGFVDEAVTGEKFDWGSIVEFIESAETWADDGKTFWVGPQYLKFDNGLMVVYGHTPGTRVNANSTVDLSYTLSTPFVKTPTVVVGMASDAFEDADELGDLVISNNYSTATQLKFRWFNNEQSWRYPLATFIAIGRWRD